MTTNTRDWPDWSDALAREVAESCLVLEGGLLPALHALQATFGFVPNPAIALLAELFNISRAEVFGVVTFYHDFRTDRPPGRHVLKLCRAEACQAAGSDALAARAETKLGVACGHTTADQRVTLEPVYCLGLCATAPSAMLDGRLVGRLDPARLDALIAEAQA